MYNPYGSVPLNGEYEYSVYTKTGNEFELDLVTNSVTEAIAFKYRQQNLGRETRMDRKFKPGI